MRTYSSEGLLVLCVVYLLTSCRISVTIVISFAARGLSSIGSQIFCYTAISSAGIVGILPGYLIREFALHSSVDARLTPV